MNDPLVAIEYSYYGPDKNAVEDSIRCFEALVGGERRPYFDRAGALDVLALLEVSIRIGVTPVLAKYFEGLLGADELKRLGEAHRKEIANWLTKIKETADSLIVAAKLLPRSATLNFYQGKPRALALVFQIAEIQCYVVLNHERATTDSISRLPNAILRVYQFALDPGLPRDTSVAQLYLDPDSLDWRYLLIPTTSAFGHYIDRYVDLKTGRTVRIRSRKEFARVFRPSPGDEYKFVVSPFRGSRNE